MHNITYAQMKILETKRCILRPVTLDDAKDLFQYYKEDIVVRYLPFNKHKTLADTKRFISLFFLNNYKQGKIGHYAIVFKNDKRVIGNVGFNNIPINSSEGEIGICINPNYWGYNISTELAIELLRYGFEELKLKKIIATTFGTNKYSQKSLNNLGFNYIGEFNKRLNTVSQQNIVKYNKYEMLRTYYMKNKHKIIYKLY